MGRKNRSYRKNGIYHIVHRGNNKTFIFDDMLDKQKFHDIIEGVLIEQPFNLLYYVFMDNHYHLLVEIMDSSISDIMKLINLRYSKYYNNKYNRVGTIFGGRYSPFEVLSAAHLVKVVGYIAYNPVKAKLVKNPADYRWSAHYDMIAEMDGIDAPDAPDALNGIINKNRLLALMDDSPKRALEIYNEIISKKIVDYAYDHVVDKAVNSDDCREIRRKKIKKEAMVAMRYNSENFKGLFSDKRTSERLRLRRVCVVHLKSEGYSHDEIADFMGITERTVHNLSR